MDLDSRTSVMTSENDPQSPNANLLNFHFMFHLIECIEIELWQKVCVAFAHFFFTKLNKQQKPTWGKAINVSYFGT